MAIMVTAMTAEDRFDVACDNAEEAIQHYTQSEADRAMLKKVVDALRNGARTNTELRVMYPRVQALATRRPPASCRDNVPEPENPSEWAAAAVESLIRCSIAENFKILSEDDAAKAAMRMTAGCRDCAQARHTMIQEG